MELYDLLNDNASLNVTINAGQLIEVINYAVSKTKAEFETKQDPEQYITRKQAAQMLDVDLSSLWRWDKQGYLVPVEIGGKRRYRMSDIKKILDSGKKSIGKERP
jgi:hypothetical protein